MYVRPFSDLSLCQCQPIPEGPPSEHSSHGCSSYARFSNLLPQLQSVSLISSLILPPPGPIFYSLLSATTSFSSPSLISLLMFPGFLLPLSTNTCVCPPTAAADSTPSSNTPTSYVAELLPSFNTRNPSSNTCGYPTGR